MPTLRVVRDVKVVRDQDAATMILTTNGTMFNTQNFIEMSVFIETENSGGTNPTLDITVETYDPVMGNWFDVGMVFTQIVGNTTQHLTNNTLTYGFFMALGQFCRLVYTIAGTSPTFDVTATVVLKS